MAAIIWYILNSKKQIVSQFSEFLSTLRPRTYHQQKKMLSNSSSTKNTAAPKAAKAQEYSDLQLALRMQNDYYRRAAHKRALFHEEQDNHRRHARLARLGGMITRQNNSNSVNQSRGRSMF